MDWFQVDKEGLGKLLAQRGKEFVVYELLQNAWDEESRVVSVELQRIPGRRLVSLVVTDDHPQGFSNLEHAWTLFAESRKKADPEKRGRFNLGEKLVLAICKEVTIASTTGTVHFRPDGTRQVSRKRTQQGSRFEALIPMTAAEQEAVWRAMERLIPPKSVFTTFNGRPLPTREQVVEFTVKLPTLLADGLGVLRPTTRKTTVQLFEPRVGETATLYELGIPVVETGDRYHVNVLQKVPLNMDRDNVTASYLRTIRTVVLNHTHDRLTSEDIAREWVGAALADPSVELTTVQSIVDQRFGTAAVTADPSDIEALHTAVSKGYVVVHGGQYTKEQWSNIRRTDRLPRAGLLFPTPKPYSDDLDAPPTDVVPPQEWTDGMQQVVALAEQLSERLMGVKLDVRIVRTPNRFRACYGRRSVDRGVMDLNLRWLGRRWFDEWPSQLAEVLDLLIHELGHHFGESHLSESYHKGLTQLAGSLAVLALQNPDLFQS